MSNSLRATVEGLAIVDRARQKRGWTKTSTARWWQDAHTSRATLRRFWQGDRIQREIFIALCQVVGIADWQAIAAPSEGIADNLDENNLDENNPPDILPIPALDWNEIPDVEHFYGRAQELVELEHWVKDDSAKVMVIAGFPGIGKTSLALSFVDRIQPQFEGIIWRSLQFSPPLLTLLNGLLHSLGQSAASHNQQAINQLLQSLQQHPYLLVLDGLDAVLTEASSVEYTQFIQQFHHHRHQSLLLLTSREQPDAIALNLNTSRCLRLQGLSQADALTLLQSLGLANHDAELIALIGQCRGNPLLLKLVAPLIQTVFGGRVAMFLQQKTLVLDEQIRSIFKQQFEHLSHPERDVLYWLAIWQEPISLSRLQTHWLPTPDPATLLDAIASLDRRSLLERWIDTTWTNAPTLSFTLSPVLMQWVTCELIEWVTQEIHYIFEHQTLRHCNVLRSHLLLRPGTDEITGDRIIKQLRNKLLQLYGAGLPEMLIQTIALLKNQSPLAIGYIGCNVMSLLKPFGIED